MKGFFYKLSLLLLVAFMPLTAIAERPERGYRGFLQWSNSIRSNEGVTNYYTGASTTHGFQINNMFFAGLGVMAEYCSKNEGPYSWASLVTSPWFVSVYADGRADFAFGSFTPYADLRLGYSFEPDRGAYIAPSVGYRFKGLGSVVFNVNLGMSLTTYSIQEIVGPIYDGVQTPTNYISKDKVRAYFTFGLGVEF